MQHSEFLLKQKKSYQNKLSLLSLWTILLLGCFCWYNGAMALEPGEFLSARNRCFQRERVPTHYQQQFDKFKYANETLVQRYLYCLWSQELGLWHDRNGFDAARIAHLYGDRVNDEIAVPIISECNRSGKTSNNITPQRWCYNAFICILNSRIGQWYKRSTSDIINGNY